MKVFLLIFIMAGYPKQSQNGIIEFADGNDCERVLAKLVQDADKADVKYTTNKCFQITAKKE